MSYKYSPSAEERKRQARAYYHANKQRINRRRKAWRSLHKERLSKISKEYYKKNSNIIRAKVTARYRKTMANPVTRNLRRKHALDYYARNITKGREYAKRYRNKHVLLCRSRIAKWQKAHPESAIKKTATRRARVMGAEGSFTNDQVLVLHDNQKGLCAICKKKLPTSFHRDHIIPLSGGGSNWINNIQLTCAKCNQRKGAKLPTITKREK